MKLSVVIVNYNVKYFLEQCLRSVYAAAEGIDTDVWVVDNNSIDGSVQMIREKFPEVHLIANSDNPGFAKANNQAIREILNGERRTENGERKAQERRLPACKQKDESAGAQASSLQAENGELHDATHPGLRPPLSERECATLDGESGHYILLLNPDTLVQKDTFRVCIDFFDGHKDCGGLSVKMIDGEGRFLKESKRGFPSPATSFYKISGLIKLFPHNRKVGAYYMGHLDDDTVNEVDVLPGAFLMISREALEKTGLLDESYFMYGEDIDFSWRIKLAGYKNYYLPTTRILHYKGESTKKSSMNYVYTFYNAMAIFARKYFRGNGAKMYTLLIQCAIWLRASLDFGKRLVGRLAVPALDFAASFAGFLAIKSIWATYWAENVNYYPAFYTWTILPLYVLILLLASWLRGGYDKPLRIGRIVQGMGIGALCLLVFYSLLSEELRFSRAIVLLGSVWSIASAIVIRMLLSLLNVEGYKLRPDSGKSRLIVGDKSEYDRVSNELFDTLGIESKYVKNLPPQKITDLSDATKDIEDLMDARSSIDEIIFCTKDISVSAILSVTERLRGKGISFRTAPEGMNVLIGSNYTNSPEELYTPDFGNISNATNCRSKRLFDIIAALLLLVLSPILFWPQKRKRRYFADCLSVLFGKKSWVGYSRQTENGERRTENEERRTENRERRAENPLPAIRKGVFRTRDRMPQVKNPDCERLDRSYATNYKVNTDITILFINIFNI